MRHHTLDVVLLDSGEAGEAFLADVCRMLGAIAARATLGLSSFELVSDGGASRRLRATSTAALPSALLRELGVHRAQGAPPHAPTGRIQTVRVSVEADTAELQSSPILKTYNYLDRTVVRHATGERLPLDVVLAGSAG